MPKMKGMTLNAHEALGYFLQHLVGSKGASKHTVSAYRRDLHQFFASITGEVEFDPEEQQLKRYLHANQAEMKNRQQWLYKNLIVKNFQEKDVVTRHEAEQVWESYLTEKQLRVMEQPINSLSPTGLYQYLEYLRASEQATERFEMVFWQKATLPVAIIIMMLCSFPFVFGSLRSSSAGKRIVLATIIGIAFHLFSQSLVNLGLMLDISPLLTTLIPIVVILFLGAVWMRRAL